MASDCCCQDRLPNAGATQPTAWPTTSKLTLANYWDHFLARCGVNRNRRRTRPGLYTLGSPTPDSPVLVTANYRLSFDALRSALPGTDGYILVLDTRGINVWCAAGKGTFGTDEIVTRIESTNLGKVVEHRLLILPQLGAAGVSAHEVKRRSGFDVKYGPVRARDLPEYMKTHSATAEMRRVRFGLVDRMILIPVELQHLLVPALVTAAVLYALVGPVACLAAVASFLAGAALFPIFLPWLPTPNFSTKGLILGVLVALPFALWMLLGREGLAGIFGQSGVRSGVGNLGTDSASAWGFRAGWGLVCVLVMAPVTAFVSLNFTGSTPFTSRTGVRREIFSYVPTMAWMLAGALVLAISLSVGRGVA